ncbi:Arginase/deacetylase [Aureobasidium subglaciale]|nr:Arginase/deacetylase [Aureobasidium subglaciale]KAI5226952.1 Arginase/deacetylase [Aureobasidium subglaciale]KAI5230118.1 Arginase/deacetylase [Aureobasidium subglaciale]KAI5264728.1 Arginase/deacetylase [Aureobasidium subglaciale]
MAEHPRSSPGPGQHRDQSPSLSRNLDRLSLARSNSPADRRSASRVASSPITSNFRSTTPSAYESPHALRRASSSMSQAGTPPRRKSSMSSLRSMTNQTSPAGSPRRGDRSGSMTSSYSHTVIEEPPPLSAAQVASAHFAQELALHDLDTTTAQVAVILHDACYGHRFSRPKTSKGMLSMIVERPERVLAAVLGLASAYVRLGSRHAGGQHAPHPDKQPDSRIPFRIKKTSRAVPLTSAFISAVHGTEWMKELETMCNVAGEKLASHMKELARPEVPGATTQKQPFHEGDLYLCSESLNALQGAVGGVCEAVDTIFSSIPTSPRRVFVAIRPPGHHCSSDFPSGFCWINNVHIGIEYAAQTYGLTHAVILDIDLHHGDGSQDITWERNMKSARMPKSASFTKKTAIGYYSMHDINSYPCEDGDKDKVTNASVCIDNIHNQSIWNVHLEAWRTMDEFWALYETKYSILLEKARTFLRRHSQTIKDSHKQAPPKAAIFISAGFDASQWEGAVNVPTEFYARFAKDVVKLAQEEGTGVHGRVISVLEGGYSDRALCSGVLSHISGLCQDPNAVATNGVHTQPADDDIASAMQSMNISSPANGLSHWSPEYDPSWWDVKNLHALETHVTPPPPPAPTRTQRTAMPTYATPTQSFTGKVVDPLKFQRSISGTMRPMSPRPAGLRAPPEVDWIVAVHELSKLIIPSDRQTRSHAPEDLAPVRVKKDRLSAPVAAPAEQVVGGRQLRTRKPKGAGTVSPPTEADMSTKLPPIDLARRQTIADIPKFIDVQPVPTTLGGPKRMTRRTSNLFDLKSEDTDVPSVPAIPAQPPLSPRKARAKVPKLPSPGELPKKEELPVKQEYPVKREQENVPLVKLETRMARPEPKRFPSEASIPTAMPLTIDYTRPINHIEPLRPAGIKRIHLKVGTREEHDRRVREMEEKSKTNAESRFVQGDTVVFQRPVEPVRSTSEQYGVKVEESDAEFGAAPTAEQQLLRRQPASVSKTVPSELTHRESPLYLDLEPSIKQSTPQPPIDPLAVPAQHPSPQSFGPQQAMQQHTQEVQPIEPQKLTDQLTAPQRPPPPQQQERPIEAQRQTFFNPSYTHPQNSLPVFSSTGAIPFATAQGRPNGPNPVSGHGDGVSRSMLEGMPALSKVVTPDDVDMMDLDSPEKRRDVKGERIIPETPQH